MKAFTLFSALILCFTSARSESKASSELVVVEREPLNQITITRNGKVIAFNSAPEDSNPEHLFLTHVRRDTADAAIQSAPPEKWITSAASADVLTTAESHWEKWWDDRFNYYQQQVQKIPLKNHSPGTVMNVGEPLKWQGLTVTMIATPGYTRDGTSWLVEFEKRKVLITGDLILAGGRVPDLYSFQNEIRDAKVGGYHGYMGRIAVWLQSIKKIRALGVDSIIPSRGPSISKPEETLDTAAQLARDIYRSYLRTNALHWYFGEERMNTCARRVLGPDHGVSGLPFAKHVDLPDWCQHMGTTKLLVSKVGHGFALDVGGAKALETLRKALADGLVKSIDGIFVTHTHNDHTAAVGEAAREFGCPVYAVEEVADTLENPGNWFLPGVSPNAVDKITVKKDGETMKWKNFDFTFHFYPGQMYNHGALLVKEAAHAPVFFIGDSFSPSGIDDYCLMNRNLMRDDTGYALCFRKIEALPEDTWLVNQHIPHLFRFSDDERNFLKQEYAKRKEAIAKFVDWDNPNYGIDEQWAKFFPYGQEVNAGETATVEVEIWNHSEVERTFSIQMNDTIGNTFSKGAVSIPRFERASSSFHLKIPADTPEGIYILTADIKRDDGKEHPSWCETIFKVVH